MMIRNLNRIPIRNRNRISNADFDPHPHTQCSFASALSSATACESADL